MDLRKTKFYQEEFIKRAKYLSEADKYIFMQLYKTFKEQIGILDSLAKSIKGEGTTVEKEYVKNRPSITVHPAISQYNNTSKAMNNTILTILKVLERTDDKGSAEFDVIQKLKVGKK